MSISICHCVFEYLYRDASNYKVHSAVLLEGLYRDDHRAAIVSILNAGLYFIPQQIGLSPLQSELYAYSSGPTEDDHAWHEFVGLYPAESSDVARLSQAGTVDEFVARFLAVGLWREAF